MTMTPQLPHVSRGSLQMFSGAAGLIAGFAAISLSFLLWQSPAAVTHNATRAITTVLAVVALGSLAALLLRFSLSRSDPHALHTRMQMRH